MVPTCVLLADICGSMYYRVPLPIIIGLLPSRQTFTIHLSIHLPIHPCAGYWRHKDIKVAKALPCTSLEHSKVVL